MTSISQKKRGVDFEVDVADGGVQGEPPEPAVGLHVDRLLVVLQLDQLHLQVLLLLFLNISS